LFYLTKLLSLKKISMRVLFFLVMLAISLQPYHNKFQWKLESCTTKQLSKPDLLGYSNSTTGSLNVFAYKKRKPVLSKTEPLQQKFNQNPTSQPFRFSTLGDFNVNIINFVSTIEGGYPFTYKPTILKGFTIRTINGIKICWEYYC
jgi:hypothetical protein